MKKDKKKNLNKLKDKKVTAIIAAAVLVVAIAVGVSAFFNVKNKRAQTSFESVTETVLSESTEETVSESDTQPIETESQTETKKSEPKVKPVGTTKPVEKETEKFKDNGSNKVNKGDPTLKLLNVPYINQMPTFPAGCEAVSTVMALKYFGYNISPETYINNCLPQGKRPFTDETGQLFGDDPNECFLGSPYDKWGWGCYAPVITKGVNKVIDHSKHKVVNVSGSSMSTLCSKYIDNDIPVIIWASQGMAPMHVSKTWYTLSHDGQVSWMTPNHCLLLVGYDSTNYYFNDPLTSKNHAFRRSLVESRYAQNHSQAVVIMPVTPETTAAPTTKSETTTEKTTTTTTKVTTVTAKPETTTVLTSSAD